MRLLIFLSVGLMLCVAVPQNELRARLRGARRFSLSTPGLQSTDTADQIPDTADKPSTPEENAIRSRGRDRGTSLPRRGRPSLNLRGSRTDSLRNSQAEPESEVEEAQPETQTAAAPRSNVRSGLQLRRLQKPTTTTTTTTTTPAPEVEEITEMLLDLKHASPVDVMEEKMMMEKSKAIAIDTLAEIIDETDEPILAERMEATESPKPKLRPLPVKLGGRTQGAVVLRQQPEEAVANEEPQPFPSEAPAVSQHRFAAKSRSPLRIRSRGQGTETQNQTPELPADDEPVAETPRIRSPVRKSSFRQSPRVSLRSRTPPTDEPSAPEEETPDVVIPETVSRSALFGRRSSNK